LDYGGVVIQQTLMMAQKWERLNYFGLMGIVTHIPGNLKVV